MQNRTAKFVSAIFASLLAGTPLTTVSHGAVPAADDCLSKPKGLAPEGSHWYYRIDRATKRHCWYLGDQREKLSRPGHKSGSRSPTRFATERDANAAAGRRCTRRTALAADARSSRTERPLATDSARQPRMRRASENGQPATRGTLKRSARSSLRAGPTRRARVRQQSSADDGQFGRAAQLNSEQAPLPAVATFAPQ